MAVAAKNTAILLNQYTLTGSSNACSVAVTAPALDTTPFGVNAHTYVAGLYGATMTHAGYVNIDGEGELEKELWDNLGAASTVYVAQLYGTASVDCPAYVLPTAWNGQLNIAAELGNVITVDGEWQEATGLRRGKRIFGSATLSATGTQTAYDFGAAGSAGGDGWLFVSAITGTATNATIDIESATTEGGVYSSEGTFTFSAVGTTAIALSGTVNRWLRINCTDLGGATDFTVTAIAAVDGVTQ